MKFGFTQNPKHQWLYPARQTVNCLFDELDMTEERRYINDQEPDRILESSRKQAS